MTEIVSVLKQYPALKLEVYSHTDSRANAAYNVGLSQRRMNSSVAYLIGKGVKAEQIIKKEYMGENKLTNDCGDDKNCNKVQHQLNRRTEFVVVR